MGSPSISSACTSFRCLRSALALELVALVLVSTRICGTWLNITNQDHTRMFPQKARKYHSAKQDIPLNIQEARVEKMYQELMGILLTPLRFESVGNLWHVFQKPHRFQRLMAAVERFNGMLLQQAESTNSALLLAFALRCVLLRKQKLLQGRGVHKDLQHAVEKAGVAKVLQATSVPSRVRFLKQGQEALAREEVVLRLWWFILHIYSLLRPSIRCFDKVDHSGKQRFFREQSSNAILHLARIHGKTRSKWKNVPGTELLDNQLLHVCELGGKFPQKVFANLARN